MLFESSDDLGKEINKYKFAKTKYDIYLNDMD